MDKFFYGDNPSQFGELRLPDTKGPHPVAIVIHGGFWRQAFSLELTREIAEDLTKHGWATWNIEYRRVGQKEAGWPNTLLDTAKACDYLTHLTEEYQLDLEKVVTIGHSAGGQLALWLAGRTKLSSDSELAYTPNPLPVAGAISLAGVIDLESMYKVHQYRDETLSASPNNPTAELLSGSPEETPERYKEASPIALVPLNVPQLLVHGSLDVNVPVGISHNYYRACEEAGDPIKLIELSSAEHFMLTDTTSEAWKVIREEMELMLESLS
ncbi:alpha/beta hydrolase [Halobacillus salinarum]|uniref:Alpha/beta hydrolase n=1 Tax=Halobacillus salinarum TaxID=2932257 RepID=A0ABY4EIW9_9BACI|nr:alpha/beta hydrolase [Halobacillus salinarum]UOQ43992.1 alpha/beta hydrolase [Halobacillus salinarum]